MFYFIELECLMEILINFMLKKQIGRYPCCDFDWINCCPINTVLYTVYNTS